MLCGWDPFTVQVKGSMVNVLAKKFVFTSTQPPGQWYKDPTKGRAASTLAQSTATLRLCRAFARAARCITSTCRRWFLIPMNSYHTQKC
jgi:hypothetical protein